MHKAVKMFKRDGILPVLSSVVARIRSELLRQQHSYPIGFQVEQGTAWLTGPYASIGEGLRVGLTGWAYKRSGFRPPDCTTPACAHAATRNELSAHAAQAVAGAWRAARAREDMQCGVSVQGIHLVVGILREAAQRKGGHLL